MSTKSLHNRDLSVNRDLNVNRAPRENGATASRLLNPRFTNHQHTTPNRNSEESNVQTDEEKTKPMTASQNPYDREPARRRKRPRV